MGDVFKNVFYYNSMHVLLRLKTPNCYDQLIASNQKETEDIDLTRIHLLSPNTTMLILKSLSSQF